MLASAEPEKLFEYRLDDKQKERPPSYRLVWAVLKRGVVSLHWYAAGILAAVMQCGIQFLMPIPSAVIVGSILPMVADPESSSYGLITCCLAWAAIRVLSSMITLMYTYATSEGSYDLMLHLRKLFLIDLEHLSDETKDGFGQGRLYTTYNADLASYAQFYQQFLPRLLADSLKVVGTFAIIFILSPPIFTFLILIIPLQLVLMSFFRSRIRNLHLEVKRTRDDAMSLFNESLINSDLIKSFHAQERITGRTIEKVEEMIRQARKARNRQLVWTVSSGLISMGFSVGIALIAGLQVIDGAISLTFYIVINSYAQAVLVPIEGLIALCQQIIPLLVGAQWCEEFYEAAEKEESKPRPEKLPIRTQGIEFHEVTFRYPGTPETAKPALENISCRIPSGRISVLCGPSGCGKTTMLKLLRGSLETQDGKVLLGGVDITQIDRGTLSQLMAMLSQKISLMSMSILQNAQLLSPSSKEKDLAHSLRMANILKELEDLEQETPQEVEDPEHTGFTTLSRLLFGTSPERVRLKEKRTGLDRLAGTSGNLSGGQQQRVSIGFALLTQCPILLFDEPTSGLDKFSENELVETISGLAGEDRTIVVVSHSLPPYFVLPDDKVNFVFLKDGKLVAQGPKSKLLRSCPEFRELAKENVRHVLAMNREDLDLLTA